MVTMMSDGSKISVYKNGQKVAESSSVSGISYDSCLTIGLHHQTNGQWYYFDGKIDDVAIWDQPFFSEINQLVSGRNQNTIYFDGATSKCPNATAGDKAFINGTLYKAVNNSTIAGEIANGNYNLCTTLVTNMSFV